MGMHPILGDLNLRQSIGSCLQRMSMTPLRARSHPRAKVAPSRSALLIAEPRWLLLCPCRRLNVFPTCMHKPQLLVSLREQLQTDFGHEDVISDLWMRRFEVLVGMGTGSFIVLFQQRTMSLMRMYIQPLRTNVFKTATTADRRAAPACCTLAITNHWIHQVPANLVPLVHAQSGTIP
ncbi:hypothetical protein VNO77_08570 [Canavalia gladiata]|uniref:Uncharacterized protein n=1 Tax=Canavalia gladiata TaxID=3824 RepID=A0AAN9M8L9_CANGL